MDLNLQAFSFLYVRMRKPALNVQTDSIRAKVFI